MDVGTELVMVIVRKSKSSSLHNTRDYTRVGSRSQLFDGQLTVFYIAFSNNWCLFLH